MDNNQVFNNKKVLNLGGRLIEIDQPKIMGILNLTDDSFYDGGRFNNLNNAIKQTEKMLIDGATIIDLGAQSSRPGAKLKTDQQEIEIIIPVLNELMKEFPYAIYSVDTWYSNVAEQTINIGAHMINDISGGLFDSSMFDIIAKYNVPYVLMHTGGRPDEMQINPIYNNVVSDVLKFLANQVEVLSKKGVNDIIIDPGFGFGKTYEHNFTLLNALKHFSFLEKPILVGLSRKSMIYKTLDLDPENALTGTIALEMFALLQGANILRVHDVKETGELIKLFQTIKDNSETFGY